MWIGLYLTGGKLCSQMSPDLPYNLMISMKGSGGNKTHGISSRISPNMMHSTRWKHHDLDRDFIWISHDLDIYRHSSVTDVWYWDEVLDPIVKLYAAAVGLSFILMDNNTRPYKAAIVTDCLESEGIAWMEWPVYLPDYKQIKNLWNAFSHKPLNVVKEIPLLSPKVTVRSGFMAEMITGPFFYENISPRGPAACSVINAKYCQMLNNFVNLEMMSGENHFHARWSPSTHCFAGTEAAAMT